MAIESNEDGATSEHPWSVGKTLIGKFNALRRGTENEHNGSESQGTSLNSASMDAANPSLTPAEQATWQRYIMDRRK